MTDATQEEGGFRRALKKPLIRYPLYGIFGTVMLLAVIGGYTDLVESTNTLEFCISCHDMRYNYEEYKKTVHYSNKSGVRAVCSDCHVPKREWFTEMRRKLVAGQDVLAELMGVVDTKEKFEARRAAMAKREWARMKESDSIGCRNCHAFESMDMNSQDKLASRKHVRAQAGEGTDKTCIDCHKGIVHSLPKTEGG